MQSERIETERLTLVLSTREEARELVEAMSPEDLAQLSPAWLALLDGSGPADPWIHGFRVLHRETGKCVGQCGFKGPPGTDGVVEIAYGISPEHQGNGYATEAAAALTAYAMTDGRILVVRAHTLPERNASSRVLTKCGFAHLGEVIDPEDGRVWRWEKTRASNSQPPASP